MSQQIIGDAPGVYGRFFDNSAYPTEAAASIGMFVLESAKGRRGLYKAINPEDALEEYGHNPRASLTTYGPLLFLQESNRAVCARATNGALNATAVLAVVPALVNTPEGMANTTVFRSGIVGETNDSKDLRMSDDMILTFYDLSPGKSDKNIRLLPEMVDPEGGFWVELYRGSEAQPIERYQVSLTYRSNGQNDQMFIEQVINQRSSRIRVVVNLNTEFQLTDDLVDQEFRAYLSAGDAGAKVVASDVIETLKLAADPERIRFDTLVLAGWENPQIQRAGTALCQARKDAFAIMDVPRSMQAPTQAVAYRKNDLRIDSSYAALYSKYVIIADQYTNMNVPIPLSAAVGGCYAYTDRQFRASYAPAGRRRGDLQRFNVISVDGDPYSAPEREILFAAQVNGIKTLDEVGSFVWNDSTLQLRNSLLSMIGVSRMRNKLYVKISDVLDMYVFDPNSSQLRDQIDSVCRDILTDEERNQSIKNIKTGFSEKLNTGRATDSGKLFYYVMYTPIASTRQIIVDYTLTNSSVDSSVSVA